MKLLSFLVLLLTRLSFSADLPKVCFSTVDAKEFCTTDNLGSVQVFVFNAGWCGPCNEEMAELSSTNAQFQGKKVVFASLSGEGYSHGAKPDQSFLQNWKQKHKIPFVVAGKYREFGSLFGFSGSIPFAAIIDSKGSIVQKGFIQADAINKKVNDLLKDIPEETVAAKTFFEKIRGNYVVDKVAGQPPHDASNLASVAWDAEFPNLEMVYMPYCVEESCMDSGNYFVYDNTTVTKNAKGYRITFKSDGKDLNYDWEELADGKFLYRNLQFKGMSDTPVVLEHVLKKATD